MAFAVNGKDCVVQVWSVALAQYLTLACSKGMQLTVNSEMGATTTVDSGFWKSVKPSGLSDWSVSLTGVLFNRDTVVNKFFIYDLITEQARLNGLNIKMVFTDKEGFIRTITGFVFIPTSVLGGDAGTLAQWSAEMIGSGPLDLTGTVITGAVAGEPFSDYWTTTPGATSISGLSAIHGYSLIGKTVLEVDREGMEWDLVTAAPTGRQARHNSGTGAVDFDTTLGFNTGETIFVLFK